MSQPNGFSVCNSHYENKPSQKGMSEVKLLWLAPSLICTCQWGSFIPMMEGP